MYGNDIVKDNEQGHYHSGRRFFNFDLALIIGFNILILACVYLPFVSGTIVRPISSIIMVLFVPGYSLVAALYPGKADIDDIERMALSFGLSIAIVSLAGLLANFTPWGLRLGPLIAILTIFNVLFVLIAHVRRHGLSPGARLSVDPGDVLQEIKRYLLAPDGTPHYLTFLATAAIVLIICATMAYFMFGQARVDNFTEFYILGPEGKMSGYPADFILGNEKSVIVGIVNHEYKAVNYDLVISINNSTNVLYTEPITLADNQTWQKTILIKPGSIGSNEKLMFLLYNDGSSSTPYRECDLYVNVLTMAAQIPPGGQEYPGRSRKVDM